MKTGIRDWGLGIRNQRSGGRGPRAGEGSRFKVQCSMSSWGTLDAGEKGNGLHLPTGRYPRTTLPNPQSLIPNPSRRGISLMEVLISVFILSIGLLGVAAMIPIGKLAMIETSKSDRTGACGRAALREVKVRRMLAGFATSTTPFVIDPLGVTAGITTNLGSLPRTNYASMNKFQADDLFRWRDDLIYFQPKDMTAGNSPTNGERPAGAFTDSNYSTISTTINTTTGVVIPASEGNYSWFLTVAPQIVNSVNTGTFSVAAVVCYKRVLTKNSSGQPDGERNILSTNVTCDSSPSYGGVGITIKGNVIAGPPPLKSNEWILLYSTTQCTWYRVVSVGYDASAVPPSTRIALVGPDWYGGSSATVVVVGGVTGVYTTTVQLDDDKIWTR